jgi:hypothetical protein
MYISKLPEDQFEDRGKTAKFVSLEYGLLVLDHFNIVLESIKLLFEDISNKDSSMETHFKSSKPKEVAI